jgi:predicted lysophospholipase L1 biosynthesis ABC-type transport system permease subunit
LGSALLPSFTVYASVLQHPPVNVELLIRRRPGAARGPDPQAFLAGALGGPPGGVHQDGERDLVARDRTPVEWFGRLVAAEGWAVLLIAAVACALQMSLWVRARSPELGLRRAVGASRGRVLGSVLRRAAAVGLMGTAMGLVLGPALWGALGTIVRGLPPWDTGLVLRFAALLVALSMAGAVIPAWRVARTEPARLLASG